MAANSDGDENMGSPDPAILTGLDELDMQMVVMFNRLDELDKRMNATVKGVDELAVRANATYDRITKLQEETDKKIAGLANSSAGLASAVQGQAVSVQHLNTAVAGTAKALSEETGKSRERMAVLEHRCDVIDKRNDESRDAKVAAGILAEIESKKI